MTDTPEKALFPKQASMPTEKEDWMAKYVLRMVERGIDQEDALACCLAGADDHDYTSDPRDAADEEMSIWTDDGD